MTFYPNKFLVYLFLACVLVSPAWAVFPMNGYYSLVAGRGDEGYKDGPFTEAQFHWPDGLAVNGDGTQLYVASGRNRSIRKVDLAHQNRVTTLTGSPDINPQDGPLKKAGFARPSLLAWLPPDQLVVLDEGDKPLRLVNISGGTVRTLLPGEDLSGIRDMAYDTQERALFFTQPLQHRLSKIVFSKNPPRLERVSIEAGKGLDLPGCLCVDGDRVYISDQKTSAVYCLETKSGELRFVDQGKKITNLTLSGGQLYALQADKEPFVQLNPYRVIDPPLIWDSPTFWKKVEWDDPSTWKPGSKFVERGDWFSTGLHSVLIAAGPAHPGRFYLAVGSRNEIISFQDSSYKSPGMTGEGAGLLTYGHSTEKFPGTRRILLVADRELLHAEHIRDPALDAFPNSPAQDQLSLALRTQLVLNTDSALGNVPGSHEVFALESGRSGQKGLIGEIVKKYGIDQVLILETGGENSSPSANWLADALPSSSGVRLAGVFIPGIGSTAEADSVDHEKFWKNYFASRGYAFWDLTDVWSALKVTYFPIVDAPVSPWQLMSQTLAGWLHGPGTFSGVWSTVKVCLAGGKTTPKLNNRGRILFSWLLSREILSRSEAANPRQKPRPLCPIHLYQDLTAGEGSSGYAEGPFAQALFDQPKALAMNEAGTEIYVADSLNHRIRKIDLSRDNRVETLAGNGTEGNQDGKLLTAAFEKPELLAPTEEGLIVFDAGSSRFRILNFKTGMVSTLRPRLNGQELEAGHFQSVFALLYEPTQRALYVTNPEAGRLEKIDLDSGELKIILEGDRRVPHPGALCLFQGYLCLADRTSPDLYQLSFEDPDQAQLTVVGQSPKTLALAAWKDKLYAVQGPPLNWVRVIPANNNLSISVMSAYRRPVPFDFGAFEGFPPGMAGAVGFVADPRHEKQFYVSSPRLNQVYSLRDFEFARVMTKEAFHSGIVNGDGVRDWEYPIEKGKKCFRVLVVGDSHIYRNGAGANALESIDNRMELFLNTLSAVEGWGIQFQVFNCGVPNSDDTPPYYWPAFKVPALVKKYDIDEVFYCLNAETTDSNIAPFYQRPLGPDEVPVWKKDPEFFLTPFSQRIPAGRIGELLRRNTGKNGAHTPFRQLITNDRDRADLAYAFSRPILKLKKELASSRTRDGRKIGLQLFYFPTGPSGLYSLTEPYRSLWSEAAADARIPFVDLTGDFIALRQDYFPAAEKFNSLHPTANGFSLKGFILIHELIEHHWIPLK